MPDTKYAKYVDLIKPRLTHGRFIHSLCVMEAAGKLADLFGADREQAKLAGLLHDIAKDTPPEEQLALLDAHNVPMTQLERNTTKLYHAMSGVVLVKEEAGVTDPAILDAIRYHTTGRAGMTDLEKILYMADFISDDRTYEGVDELRELAYRDFPAAMRYALAYTIRDLVDRGLPVHPDTVAAWNEYSEQKRKEQ